MNDQTFLGGVGQVAAGDINNYGTQDLADLNRDQVAEHLLRIQERLKDARRKVLFNPAVIWMAIGAAVLITMVLTGFFFGHTAVFAATFFLGLTLPWFFVISLQRRYGPMIFAYRQEISRIEILQHSRGWA
jgi:hypothetical protein